MAHSYELSCPYCNRNLQSFLLKKGIYTVIDQKHSCIDCDEKFKVCYEEDFDQFTGLEDEYWWLEKI